MKVIVKRPMVVICNGELLQTKYAKKKDKDVFVLPKHKPLKDTDRMWLEDFKGYIYKRTDFTNESNYVFQQI